MGVEIGGGVRMGSKTSDSNDRRSNRQSHQQGLIRRTFLQKTGLVAGALGLADLSIKLGMPERAKAYSQALAEPNGRKLALLIGIDDYSKKAIPESQIGPHKLAGCGTDIALQRALLIHRFGFLPSDIVCLTNAQATREGIYDAFVSHLYEQAKAGDTVVFHFSGYGAQVRISDLAGGRSPLRSLVPFDGLLPTESRPVLNDISEIELKALLGLLKTKNVTTVLDAGFVDIAVPLSGGLRSRARSELVTGRLPATFPLLTSQRPAKESDPFPGILLRGAAIDDIVLERQWNDFNAGAFTYVLTQHLWTASAPVTAKRSLARTQETLSRWGGSSQQPTISGKQDRTKEFPVYSTSLMDSTRGEGVITDLSDDGKTATIWFGGLPPRVLEYLGAPAVVSCAGRRLKLRSHDGLTGRAKLANSAANNGAPLQIGQAVFEAVRILPKDLNLVVALDSRLERIERVDATSALSTLSFVSSTSDTDLPADCLLGKPFDTKGTTLTASLSPIRISQAVAASSSSQATVREKETDKSEVDIIMDSADYAGYGLFSLTRTLVPGTLAQQEEAIKPAINRLSAKLRALMALKMLRLSENQASSQLPIRVLLEEVGEKGNRPLVSRQTFAQNSANSKEVLGFAPEVSVGSRVRYRLFNDSDRPLFYTLINVDPRERLSAFCPTMEAAVVSGNETESSEAATISADSIAPGSSVVIPSADRDWAVETPTGLVETYVVCSARPLINTFNLLLVDPNNAGKRVNPLPNPLEVMQALFSDISQDDSADGYSLNVDEWATVNFTYQTV